MEGKKTTHLGSWSGGVMVVGGGGAGSRPRSLQPTGRSQPTRSHLNTSIDTPCDPLLGAMPSSRRSRVPGRPTPEPAPV
jgi:hypothetical protein